MCLTSTVRANCKDGGSVSVLDRRSKWWAPSGMLTTTSVSERSSVTPPPDHGSRSPLLPVRETSKIKAVSSLWAHSNKIWEAFFRHKPENRNNLGGLNYFVILKFFLVLKLYAISTKHRTKEGWTRGPCGLSLIRHAQPPDFTTSVLTMKNFLGPRAKCTNTNNTGWATKWPVYKYNIQININIVMPREHQKVFTYPSLCNLLLKGAFQTVEQVTGLQITKRKMYISTYWNFIDFFYSICYKCRRKESNIGLGGRFKTIFKRNALISGLMEVLMVLTGYFGFNSQCASLL